MATKPTPGGSDGTYGTEMNAFLDVSLAADGKVLDGAVFSTSAAPTVDAGIANKKYADDISLSYIKLDDSKATTTDGGTFTSGVWQKRTVTEESDVGGHVTISSSVIVLDAGTYQCQIRCPANRVGAHSSRLRNTTGGSTVLVGTAEFGNTTDTQVSNTYIAGIFSIAGSQNLEIQHKCQTTRSSNGFGRASSMGEAEIYTIVEFWKK